jgi:membrane-bound ClpP family serine protease
MLDPMVGWALIIIAVILFLIEVMVPGQTFLMVLAAFLMTLGIIALVTKDEDFTFGAPGIGISLAVMAVSGVLTFAVYKKLGTVQKPSTTVAESLIGQKGVVVKEIIPHEISGKVRIGTTEWSARSDDKIEKGKHVEVVDSKGVHIVVEEIEPPKKRKGKKRKGEDFELDEDDVDYDDYDDYGDKR